MGRVSLRGLGIAAAIVALLAVPAVAQLIDRTLAPNAANEGIAKSLAQQIGVGRGSVTTPNSSLYIIARDPGRAVRRGRQIFQRKFTRDNGQGPVFGDGAGNIGVDLAIGAGLADSCAACHGRPRGSAGAGGDVVTRPDSRDAPHLFGLGLKEQLGDEITGDLRNLRELVIREARRQGRTLGVRLRSSGIDYGILWSDRNGNLDFRDVEGVNNDLRVRPFFLQGGTISIREFLVGAFNAEMGLQAPDPDLRSAVAGNRVVTPSGMVLDGRTDAIEAPPASSTFADPDGDGVTNEIPVSIVDFMEFYLLNYFKAGLGQVTSEVNAGLSLFNQAGCNRCHIQNHTIRSDRRVADVETVYNPGQGNPFNRMFATAQTLFVQTNDGNGPTLKRPAGNSFTVRNIFTDFKRHDLGPNFHEINYDGSLQREFLTTALWGVGDTGPYGHDGRSMNLEDVILRHGGEAQQARNLFAGTSATNRRLIMTFLEALVLFPPDDTSSNLNPANSSVAGYPQFGHGSINLGALFNDPTDPE